MYLQEHISESVHPVVVYHTGQGLSEKFRMTFSDKEGMKLDCH